MHAMNAVGIVAVLLAVVLAAPATAFDLQGHRGARGLAPENTLAAFAKALSIGVTTLETDLAVTRDGVVVVAHDPDLNPALVRDGGAWLAQRGPPIRSLTLAELQRYDVGRVDPASGYGRQWTQQVASDGERMPTLAALFALASQAAKPVRFNLETKITPRSGDATLDADAFARVVVEEVRKAGMSTRTTLQSFTGARCSRRSASNLRSPPPASPRKADRSTPSNRMRPGARRGTPASGPATMADRCRRWCVLPAARCGRRTTRASRASASTRPGRSASGCCPGR